MFHYIKDFSPYYTRISYQYFDDTAYQTATDEDYIEFTESELESITKCLQNFIIRYEDVNGIVERGFIGFSKSPRSRNPCSYETNFLIPLRGCNITVSKEKGHYDKSVCSIVSGCIIKMKDEWFYAYIVNSRAAYEYYKCDQIEGLLTFLNQNI